MSEAIAKTEKRGFKKTMKMLDLTLFTVCAVLVIDQLAASAAIGVSSIFWWVFTMVVFFIPYGLITAELGTTYPDQGGIYAWIRRAFGDKWGARTSWFWWINVAIWMPSVYILFAGIFAQMFYPEMSLWAQIAMGIGLTWVTVWVNVIALDVGKWVPNLGAFFKVGIMLTIGVAGIVYAFTHGVANEISLQTMIPRWDASLAFLPLIVYNFMGFELMSGGAEEIENPRRDIPKAIIISGVLIAAFYLLGTVGILIALPLEEIGLIEGLLDTVAKLLGDSTVATVAVYGIGLAALYTLFANMATWTIGANRSATEAAENHELPAFFGKMHPVHKTPVGSAILTGLVATGIMVIYGLMAGTSEDLFWTVFAFSTVPFLLVYIFMFSAFVKLRLTDPDTPRPYRVPGGKGVMITLAVICTLFIIQALVLFIFPPGGIDWMYSGSILVGMAVVIVVGEYLNRLARRAVAPGNETTDSAKPADSHQ